MFVFMVDSDFFFATFSLVTIRDPSSSVYKPFESNDVRPHSIHTSDQGVERLANFGHFSDQILLDQLDVFLTPKWHILEEKKLKANQP